MGERCATADLVVTLAVDAWSADSNIDSVKLDVTDGDSGDTLYTETRAIHQIDNDIVRVVAHFDAFRSNSKLFDSNQEAYRLAKKHGYPDNEIAEALNEDPVKTLSYLQAEDKK